MRAEPLRTFAFVFLAPSAPAHLTKIRQLTRTGNCATGASAMPTPRQPRTIGRAIRLIKDNNLESSSRITRTRVRQILTGEVRARRTSNNLPDNPEDAAVLWAYLLRGVIPKYSLYDGALSRLVIAFPKAFVEALETEPRALNLNYGAIAAAWDTGIMHRVIEKLLTNRLHWYVALRYIFDIHAMLMDRATADDRTADDTFVPELSRASRAQNRGNVAP